VAALAPASAVPEDARADCPGKEPVEEAVMMAAVPEARACSPVAAIRELPSFHCYYNCPAVQIFWGDHLAPPDHSDYSALANSYYSSGLPFTSLLYSPGLALPLSLSVLSLLPGYFVLRSLSLQKNEARTQFQG
jgi:hypothetical protein